jgi:sugar/nucleoside kinase (ribokinase family)
MTMVRIGCAGILVKDSFCGPLKALPRAGELVAVDPIRTSAGGCAANVAIDLRKQDLAVDIVGCLGQDAAGETLVRSLQAAGVNCDRIVYTTKYPTSETVILLVEGEDRRYLHSFGANQEFTIEHIDRDWLAGLTVFYLGGLFAMPRIDPGELLDLLTFCRKQHVVSIVDVVVPANFNRTAAMIDLLPYIDWFVPNDTEASILTGQSDPLEAIRVFEGWQANGVIVTLGERGAVAFCGAECWRCDAYSWKTIDPSGAGDAFAGGLIVGVVRGWDLPRTLIYASALGASATRAIGTTDGVLTYEAAEQLVANQPIKVTRESLPRGDKSE